MKRMLEIVHATDLSELAAARAAEPLQERPLYSVRDGVATVNVSGPLTKYETSFSSMLGGTSTLRVREALRAANSDPEVRAVLLHIESPGGTVGGTAELYDSISNSRKPVHSHIEDLGASAALWIASASKSVTANRSAAVGSIGTYTAIQDTSGAYAKEGVKVHVISSGGVKGGGVDGAPISDAYLEEAQKRIDAITDLFVEAVAKGRSHAGLTKTKVKALADGRIHLASAAKDLGLIDKVASLEEAHFSIARTAMNEDQVKAAEALAAEKVAENDRLRGELEAATATLKALAAEKELAAMQAALGTLKNLPAKSAGLAEALIAIKAAAPAEAFAVLETQIRAWDAQVKVSALFEEKGSTEGGVKETVNVNDAAAFRAAADEMVTAGKAKDRATAMQQILRTQPQGGN